MSEIDNWIQYISSKLTNQACFVKDDQGKFIYANEAFLSSCRVSSLDELIGSADIDFFPPMLASQYVADDLRVLETAMPLRNRIELTPSATSTPKWQVTNKLPIYDIDKKTPSVCGLIGSFKSPRMEGEQFANLKRLLPAVDYIRSSYFEPMKMHELAQMIYMSERAFYRNFKRTFGLSPQNYLKKHRVLEAVEIFNSQKRTNRLSIAETALKCGFYDQSHFTREFKKLMAVTPRNYILKYSRGSN